MVAQKGYGISRHKAKFNAEREIARYNMIEQQIRPWDVLSPKVLSLLNIVRREDFVDASQIGLAFADVELPIGFGQTMLSPKMEGKILQALDVKATDKVLEIGTGSGYLTALLASQASAVTSVETVLELSKNAAMRLKAQQITNTQLKVGDASSYWNDDAMYDVIAYTGSMPIIPQRMLDKLTLNGRMFCVVGQHTMMKAMLMTRVTEQHYKQEILFETFLPPLKHVVHVDTFAF